MGKESLYRRSFHCDRDLKSTEKMIELDKGFLEKKANVDTSRTHGTLDGGFEAPRNSLDVPAGGFMERRRHSEVRCEDIPIGYELSRSLTTRKKNDELPRNFTTRRNDENFLGRKSMSAVDSILSKSKLLDKGIWDDDQKSRPSSVVARLMGLDSFPQQREAESLQCPSNLSAKRVLPHDHISISVAEPSITKHSSVSRVPSQRSTTSTEPSCLPDQKPAIRSSKLLPYRDHPQEKQLQEFKKEFAMHQCKLPTTSRLDMQHGTEKSLQGEKQGFQRESLQESQEFLDALDFLQSNKDFFAKVLKDPSSLFAKHLQQRGRGESKELGLGHIKASRLTRSSSEAKRDPKPVSSAGIESFTPKRAPYICLPLAHESTDSENVCPRHCLEPLHEGPLIVHTSHFGQDEHMPRRSRSSPLKGNGNDQRLPTKIVLLRPKLRRHAKSSPPTSCSPPSDMADAGIVKARVECREGKVKHGVKERFRYEQSAARNIPKDGLQDAGDIARHIVEQVKEDMSRRLSIETPRPELSSSAKSHSRGKRAPATQRGAIYGDNSGASDGEGYCSSSRRMTRDNVKSNVSLPSSPRLSRTESEVNARMFGDKGKKSSRVCSSTNSGRDARRDNAGSGRATVLEAKQDRVRDLSPLLGRAYTKQDSIRDSEPRPSTRRGRNRGSYEKDGSEPSKVLHRSLSPSAVENRALNHEQKGTMHVHRVACSNSLRTTENSPFKERLLSLKDNLSLSKKKSSYKQGTPHSESSELANPRQSSSSSGALVREPCSTMSSVYPWRAPRLSQAQKDDTYREGCLNDVSVDNKALNGLQQWSSTGDLLDSASDVSLEKSEQPSPVSVLATPFLEESPSPEQSSSVCNEANSRFFPLESDYRKQLLGMEEAMLSSSSSRQSSLNSMVDTLCDGNGSKMPLETLSTSGIECPCGAEDELVYVRDVLSFAGFADNQYVKIHAFSREHGFNPSMFEKMENYYASVKAMIEPIPLSASRRRILFDVVDEILSRKLGQPTLPWGLIKPEKVASQVVYTGKQLLEQIWAQLRNDRYMPCDSSEEESLDALASKDLMQDASWMHSQSDIEAVAMEVEKLVCGDLIRELAYEMKLRLMFA